jgi:putative Mn2+ efflux pump MntP
MTFFEILFIAVGLSMDALAVALCAGAAGFAAPLRPALRIAFHFGLFQGLMPGLGWLAGATLAPRVVDFDHWLAFLFLGFVALRMIRSGLRGGPPDGSCDPTRGSALILLSVATSIDAMAVGFSLAMVSTPVLLPSLVIGLVTFSLSFAAARLGGRLGLRFGYRMEILGGGILLLIGLRILLAHLFFVE